METKNTVFPQEYSFPQKVIHRLAGDARALYERVYPECMPKLERTINPDVASKMMYDCLSSSMPSMIARFGCSELNVLANYMGVQKGLAGWWDFITAQQDQWWWMKSRVDALVNNAGFFPKEEWAFVRFSELLLSDMKCLDVLGSFSSREYLFQDSLKNVPKLHLLYMEPWFGMKPWTRVLEGKKVLVVHPFSELIERQYRERREEIFPGTDILPAFHLETVKAVQSLGGMDSGFTTWFDALDYMEQQIDRHDYDFCIIGCGAYGFHLAAHVKRKGRKAIHLGGVTQMLFGIKGNRWEDPQYGLPGIGIPRGWYQRLFNDAWIKPGVSYRPANAESVEGACYW